jgi:hypothetical protein
MHPFSGTLYSQPAIQFVGVQSDNEVNSGIIMQYAHLIPMFLADTPA